MSQAIRFVGPGDAAPPGADLADSPTVPGRRTRPPRAARPPRPPRAEGRRLSTPGPPRPPRRPPRAAAVPVPLTAARRVVRGALALFAVILLGFLANLVVFSPLQHAIAQQGLRSTFTGELAAGTAPVSEGTVDNVLLSDGDPVARLEIPAIGVDEIVVEGTTSAALAKGPGHRRDTVLPGQAGVSVLMGRAAAFGGPFARLQELPPGETLSIVTGQGEQIYRILGVRYAGDPSPAVSGTRLVLETARGPAFMPSGIVRVDAELVSPAQPDGARLTTYATLPPQAKELASDTSTVWALVFALQFLILAEAAAVWSYRRFGGVKTWVVFVPVLLLGGVLVADQLTRLLPNLM